MARVDFTIILFVFYLRLERVSSDGGDLRVKKISRVIFLWLSSLIYETIEKLSRRWIVKMLPIEKGQS